MQILDANALNSAKKKSFKLLRSKSSFEDLNNFSDYFFRNFFFIAQHVFIHSRCDNINIIRMSEEFSVPKYTENAQKI